MRSNRENCAEERVWEAIAGKRKRGSIGARKEVYDSGRKR